MAIVKDERLPRRAKLFYGTGDFGFALTDTVIGVLFAIFLTDVVGLAPALAAAAIFIGRTWDYINDPIIGYISDRTRSRWGRRRPFLLIGFIPFAIGFSMMWIIPPIHNQVWLAVYYGAAFFIYDTCATFVYMPYYSLTPELTEDYDERTNLTSYRMFFSIIGQLAAFVVPLAIIGSMIPANALKVTWTGIGLGLASAMPLLIVFLGTKERMEHQEQEQPTLKESVKAAFSNRPFFFAVGVFLFTNTAFSIIQSILLYFLKYHMHLEAQSDMIMGTVFIVALVSLPFWVWASKHWDKRIAYVIGMVFFSVTMIAMIMLNPSWSPVWIYILAGLAGIGVGAMDVLPWAMIPDAIEWDELKTGKRHEGMFYSLVTLFGKIDGSIAVPLMLLVMGWTGFIPNAAVQPTSAMLAIRLMTGLAPSIFLCLGILFALFYPLSRNSHAELRREIAERKAAAADLAVAVGVKEEEEV
jgi:glycoside/pentoside/hexuronide:cation symporter, GPH family